MFDPQPTERAREAIRFSRHGKKFFQFCMVGGSGVLIDMVLFGLLADPRFLGLHIAISKFIAASVAMLSNYIVNEFWTFNADGAGHRSSSELLQRMAKYCAICSIGMGIAIACLTFFTWAFGMNIHMANVLAIGVAAFWNYAINAKYNWQLN